MCLMAGPLTLAWETLRLPADPDALVASGMFAPPIAIDPDTDVQHRLLARLGRDPAWRPGPAT